jgi:hypothetical protein
LIETTLRFHQLENTGWQRDPRADFGVSASQNYRFSQDEKLKRRLGVNPVIGLFSDRTEEPVVQGHSTKC